ncbi:hypothetical protein QLX67_04210 [Balneolaceae bacterium ANBcel3]|nr:hypothetical protein [Balneolaceae bacterium ANBcel3]
MKFGLIGPGHMAATWEQHLRRITGVHEVIIATDIDALDVVDGCILLDEPDASRPVNPVLPDALKKGYHILRIGPVPTQEEIVKHLEKTALEAGCILMFSMWAHYAPSTRFLFNHVRPPKKIHIHREWPGPAFTPDPMTLYRIILEEISLCLEWSHSRPVAINGLHSLDYYLNAPEYAMHHIQVLFENDASATLFINPFGLEDRQSRFVTGEKMAAVYHINHQVVKKWLFGPQKQSHIPEVLHFENKEPAQNLLSHFIRSVRTGSKPLFGIEELCRLISAVQRFSQ